MPTTIGMGNYRYEYQPGWAKLPQGMAFQAPSAVAVDSHDRLYVFQRGDPPVLVYRVQIFAQDGEFIEEWTDFKKPMGVHIDAAGTVYVTDQVPRLSILTLDGQLLARGRTFEQAHNVYTASAGNIYGADVQHNRVQVFRKVA